MEPAKDGEKIIVQGGVDTASLAAGVSWKGNNVAKATTPIPSGGARFAPSLDMTKEKDRGLVRQAAKNWPKRWKGLTDEFKDTMVDQLRLAVDDAKEIEDPDKRASVRASIARTAVVMEGQNQSDDHKERDEQRMDDPEKVSQRIEVRFVNKMEGNADS